MKRVVLTDKLLKAQRPSDKRWDLVDSVVPGLIASVNPSGTITLMLRTRVGARSPIRRAIGLHGRITVEQARRTCRDWLELLHRGGDPNEARRQAQEEERRAALTRADQRVATVVDKLCSRKLKQQRRGYVVERIIRRDLLPHWQDRLITDLTHRDVREVIERVVERGKMTYAHRVFDAARALFGFALEHDLIEYNPCDRLKRHQLCGPHRQRERTLSNDELRALVRAGERLSYPVGPLYLMLTLTGARLNEVAGMRFSEIDWERKTWTVPASRFKSGQQHQVPLTADMLKALTALPRFKHGDACFSSTFGATPTNGAAKMKAKIDRHMLRTLKALARLRGDDPAQVTLAPFVNHDIRRTVRTALSALQIPDHICEQVIGHSRKGLARLYDMHRFESEKRKALEAWNARLRNITSPPADNVVALQAGAR